jgi:hypothetical protein
VEAMFSPIVGVCTILVVIVAKSQSGQTIVGEDTRPQCVSVLRAYRLECKQSPVPDANFSFGSIHFVELAADATSVP